VPLAASPGGRHRLQAAAAWAAWLVAVGTGSVGAIYVAMDQATGHPAYPQTPLSGIAGTAIAVAYGTIGLLLVLRRPGLVIGWLFIGIALVDGLSNLAWGYIWYGTTLGSPPGRMAIEDAAWLSNTFTYPAWIAFSLALALLFPDGRPLGPVWRRVLIAVVAVCSALAVCLAIEPGTMRLFELVNPRGAPEAWGGLIGILIPVGLGIVVALGGLSVAGVVVRYRRGDATERRQLRWFAWGAAVTLVGGAALVVAALATADPGSRLIDLGWVVFSIASISLPVAALIAILRDRLYDIDRLISRTFVFGFLTAILAGLYSALIRLFNAAFVDVTGESSEMALVLTTLILATTFTPIKKRLEDVADRRLRVASPAGDSPTDGSAGSPTQPFDDELDRRIEAIARRVSLEVLAATRVAEPDADRDAERAARRGIASPPDPATGARLEASAAQPDPG